MVRSIVEQVWYLLNVFSGLGYLVVLIFAMVWLRLLLRVVEYVAAPLSNNTRSIVHPHSEPSDLAMISECEHSTELVPTHEEKDEIKLCA